MNLGFISSLLTIQSDTELPDMNTCKKNSLAIQNLIVRIMIMYFLSNHDIDLMFAQYIIVSTMEELEKTHKS